MQNTTDDLGVQRDVITTLMRLTGCSSFKIQNPKKPSPGRQLYYWVRAGDLKQLALASDKHLDYPHIITSLRKNGYGPVWCTGIRAPGLPKKISIPPPSKGVRVSRRVLPVHCGTRVPNNIDMLMATLVAPRAKRLRKIRTLQDTGFHLVPGRDRILRLQLTENNQADENTFQDSRLPATKA